jgi:putative glutamine amidotransferase
MSEPPQPNPPDLALFASLLSTAQEPMRGFVRGMVGSVEQAQDITQDVFVDAWRAAKRRQAPFDGSGDEAAMRRWLFHVAYQRAVSALRHRSVLHVESLDGDLPLEPTRLYEPIAFEDRVAEGAALQAALDALDRQDAACLLFSVAQGFTTSEIAGILRITPAAAKKRLTRAKQRLRAAYFARQTQEASGRKGREAQ